MVTIDKCSFCKNRRENKGFRMTCNAYPEGIPYDIRDVTKLPECNNGFRYEKKEEFDIEIQSRLNDTTVIDYGIMNGNSTIVFIKPGLDGSLYGYENKYVRMAKRINKKYGCSVICSSNPSDEMNPLDNAFEVIEEYAKKFSDYKVYYLGYSNGALIGAWYGTKYEKIKRLCLVNGPLMFNWHRTKAGSLGFKGERINFVYGEEDQSAKYLPLLETIINEKIHLYTLYEDHLFSYKDEDFQTLPDYYLFYDLSNEAV